MVSLSQVENSNKEQGISVEIEWISWGRTWVSVVDVVAQEEISPTYTYSGILIIISQRAVCPLTPRQNYKVNIPSICRVLLFSLTTQERGIQRKFTWKSRIINPDFHFSKSKPTSQITKTHMKQKIQPQQIKCYYKNKGELINNT